MKTIVQSKLEKKPENGEITFDDNFNRIASVFHHSDLFALASLLKDSELYDVKGWKGLKKYNIEYEETQANYTEPTDGFAPSRCHVIPIMVALKVDDEFEHVYTLNGFQYKDCPGDLCYEESEDFISHWAWCILNTSDENTKIVAICDVNYKKK